MEALEIVRNAEEAGEAPLVLRAKTAGFAASARAAIERIQTIVLPAELEPWVKRYEAVGKRNSFLWAWVLRGLDITTLSSVDPTLRTSVLVTKLLGVVLDVLLDDIADVRQDPEMLEAALAITTGRGRRDEWQRFGPDAARYLSCIADVWAEIMTRVRALPRYQEFSEVLSYDYDQLFNTMRYAVLINRHNELLNLAENELYQPHNMHMMVNATVDLMASPIFDRGELGILRECLIRGQRMGRIGNQVSTWERELKDADYSSAVFGYAMREGIIDLTQLQSGDRETVRKALIDGEVESHFLREWQRLHDETLHLGERVVSVNVGQLVGGLRELIQLHLGSKGLK
ncbi:MAG: hypothetical protein U1E65_11010 [Myxococcota bacterium]